MSDINCYPTPFSELNAVLKNLVARTKHALGENIFGAYLVGSFAIGDFDEHSDVDFVIVTNDEISDSELQLLQAMHAKIFDDGPQWARHLEGSYIPKGRLINQPPPYREFYYIDNCGRQLNLSPHDDSLVVYWVLREKGIPLFGPPPISFVKPVSPMDLRSEILTTMQKWGRELIAEPSLMKSRWYQAFAVISFCRMLQSIQTGTIESKISGVQWGVRNLPAKWGDLIEFSWSERPNPSSKVRQLADPKILARTIDFIKYALESIRST